MDQTYNPHEGGDNSGRGHGWEVHYLPKNGIFETTEKFQTTFTQDGGCNIVIRNQILAVGVFSETPSVTTYKFSLCDIDPDSIKIKTWDLHGKDVFDCADPEQVKLHDLDCDSAELVFLTRNGATVINEETVETFTKLTGKDHELRDVSKTNKTLLLADDVRYAQRLVKALRHAVELCGGKRSKF